MKRYLLLGVVVFLVLSITLAPAGIVGRLLANEPGVDLMNPRGSIWQGQGQLWLRGQNLGALTWSVDLGSLLRLTPAADWHLAQDLASVAGRATWLGEGFSVTASGPVQADAINPWLATYDIHIEGSFNLADVLIEMDRSGQTIRDLDGQLTWTGGLARYTLSGMLHQESLPALQANLSNTGEGPRVVVTALDDSTPLMTMAQGSPGYLKIGITKRFTKLLRRPWPGSDPDHAVVLEVEEGIL